VSRADLDKRPTDVAAMFDDVASRYDLTNDVLSLGQDRLWRRAVTRAVAAQPGERVLDLAAGTGTSAEPFAAAGAQVVACDFSLGMLAVGRRRRPSLAFVAGDGLALPFADATFDAVTISFGLRNVADVDAALRDLHRVARPGGRLVVCEFSRPSAPLLRAAYVNGWLRLLPAAARRVASNPEAYIYLAESIRTWPDPPALAAQIAAAGWSRVGWRSLSAGVVTLHTGRKREVEAARP
jgi:demethylmenaquinone methyltransferase / 2-methoxy-6-polyprenyl-1,4-benzoquinol methylase